jgi:hypothetical protein
MELLGFDGDKNRASFSRLDAQVAQPDDRLDITIVVKAAVGALLVQPIEVKRLYQGLGELGARRPLVDAVERAPEDKLLAVLQPLAIKAVDWRCEIHLVRFAATRNMLEPPMVEGVEMGKLERMPVGRRHIRERREDSVDEALADIGVEDDLAGARILDEVLDACGSAGEPGATKVRRRNRCC